MGVGCIDALDVVPDTARANNLTTTFQFAPLAFIATSIANISCIYQKRMRRGLLPSHLCVSGPFLGLRRFRQITRGFRGHRGMSYAAKAIMIQGLHGVGSAEMPYKKRQEKRKF